jgi:[ribosomal protein S5]-alanine N-acetyltransferase
LGYWIGKDFWNKGYGTEAACAVLKYGFKVMGLHRIHAHHFGSNPASGKIMQKLGMTYEGTKRQHIKKWDKFEDAVVYGILKNEF